jgi:p-cumate 2,3-dioxygenase beta subunit
MTTLITPNITRNDVEEFLYREAQMLDRWQLDEWLALFTDDAIYHVPTIGTAPDVGPENTLFYIADDRARLRERVIRLQKKGAHVEWPRSRTRHMVSNVLIDERGESELQVSAAFAVHRFKNAAADVYVGSYRYRLAITGDGLRIREKRSMLDMDALRPHGRVSILL